MCCAPIAWQMCLLPDRILLMYTVFVKPGEGDLGLTIASAIGSGVVSVPYMADGRLDLSLSLATPNGTAYLVYNARQGATNLGLFLAEIDSII